tara:strand:+ start:235 stop:402 length:168 start_codon:yes stop_codon:yes gene_type:complete
MLEGSNTAVWFPPPLGLSQVPCSNLATFLFITGKIAKPGFLAILGVLFVKTVLLF